MAFTGYYIYWTCIHNIAEATAKGIILILHDSPTMSMTGRHALAVFCDEDGGISLDWCLIPWLNYADLVMHMPEPFLIRANTCTCQGLSPKNQIANHQIYIL